MISSDAKELGNLVENPKRSLVGASLRRAVFGCVFHSFLVPSVLAFYQGARASVGSSATPLVASISAT